MQVDKKNGSICYNDNEHIYWDELSGLKYRSVTQLIEMYINPFERDFWSYYKALELVLDSAIFKMESKYLKETHKFDKDYYCNNYDLDPDLLEEKKQEILDKWDAENKKSTTRGTQIHSELEETYYKKKQHDMTKMGFGGKMFTTADKGNFELNLDYGIYPEYLVHYAEGGALTDLKLAGQIDLLVKDGYDIYVFDYKTNKKLDQKSYFDTKTKKNQMMIYPMSDLMDCNMSHYTLQLSIYAWMIQQINPDFNIKKLTLIHYDHDGNVSTHDIPYIKEDVERLIKDYKKKIIKHEQARRRTRIEY